MSRTIHAFDDLLAAALGVPANAPRALIALAGPPASGKSTLSPRLARAMTEAGRPTQVVPMDGFHLDDRILDARGLRPRKGAPETFDIRGFTRFIADVATGGEVFYPLFDRTREIAIGQAAVLPDTCRTVIVEGNYLLLDADHWRDLRAFWALSIFLPVAADVLETRLMARWRDLGHTPETARQKAMGNDIPNGTRVMTALLPADILFTESAR